MPSTKAYSFGALALLCTTLVLDGAECDSIAKLTLPATTLSTAVVVSGGELQIPGAPQPIRNLPPFCRVAGVIKPSTDSNIQFEVWMPVSGWNGKFQGIGNGGYAGAISFGGLADAIRNGYATASTDTGHQAGGTDASWALNHPEKLTDFGHRAIHETTVKAKAIVGAFYGGAPKRSYFSSCSNGGRQALMEAQRYPEDYDGIIAGAPANYFTHLLLTAIAQMKVAADKESYIPASKLPAIQAAALAACDNNDGVKDGVIENPAQCKFDPAVLACQGAESERCLTAKQVTALGKLYDGLRTARGKRLFPGYAPGGEAEAGGWGPWITGTEPEKSLLFAFGTNYYRNILYGDPNRDYRTFESERDSKLALQKTAAALDATNPDLKKFRDRGGKLILYHGWSDAAIPGQNAVDYYQSVVKKMGAARSGEFVKLYMVPGMQHCGGGSGPNTFGQGGVARGDATNNIAAALERWVEQGTAPQHIIAVRGSGANARSRPLCPFPQVARYQGSGSTDDAANFECTAPSGR